MKTLFLVLLSFLLLSFGLQAQLSAEFTYEFIQDSACVKPELGPVMLLSGVSSQAVAWEWSTSDPRVVMVSSKMDRSPSLSFDFTKGEIPLDVEITLKAIDASGASETSSKVVPLNLHYAPMAKFSPGYVVEGCEPLTVEFHAAPFQVMNATLSNFRWIFGDGEESSSENPSTSHEYSSVGEFYVILEITDQQGCKGSNVPYLQTTKIIVNPSSSCK